MFLEHSLVLLMIASLVLLYNFRRHIDGDEGSYYLGMRSFAIDGKLPWADIYSHNFPFFYLFSGFVMKFVGHSFLRARIINSSFLIGTLFIYFIFFENILSFTDALLLLIFILSNQI